MNIGWEVEDGYVRAARPQSTQIDDSEIKECDTKEEAMEVIESAIQDDYDNRISWYFDDMHTVNKDINRLILEGKYENKIQ